VNRDILGFATNPHSRRKGLFKRPAANKERGGTPNLVSDDSATNHSTRTSWIKFRMFGRARKIFFYLEIY